MNLGVTATRKGLQLAQQGTVLAILKAAGLKTLHHGDCIGGDKDLHDLTRKVYGRQVRIIGHPPLDESQRAFCEVDELRPPKPYLKRNHDIVDETELLLACPGNYTMLLRGSGTWATIRYASFRKQKPLLVVFPNGKVRHEQLANLEMLLLASLGKQVVASSDRWKRGLTD
jgi:hypothetical protein